MSLILVPLFFLFSAKSPVGMYWNGGGQSRNSSRCSFSCHKRKAGENVVWYQIRDNYSHPATDSHIMSSKKLSVGLRR